MHTTFKRQLTIGLGLLFTSGIIFGGLLYYFSTTLEEQSIEITQKRSMLSKASLGSEALAQLKTDAPQANNYTELLNGLLPPNDQLLNFPDWIRGVATTHGLTLDFQFQGESVPAQSSSAGYIRFLFSTSGEKDKIDAFMDDIEVQLPRFLIHIEKFELTRNGNTYQLSGQGRVFFK